ncbi:MAG: trk/ktr system potassium uptake protein [Microbacteriaceae bacterium]|jgi:trk system potassium uptake protein TrkH|nr:trk/ktr system potassium uptake protein [Microbacteriaceae bacterium]
MTRGSFITELRDIVDLFVSSSPARFAILIFTTLILVFTGLLSLPIATASRIGTPIADALFTAVSTICVTGLSTVNMATYWSPFGNVVILLGLEVGGIGVLTLASLLGFIVARRLGLRAKLMAASDSNAGRIHAGPVAESQAIRLGEIGGLLATDPWMLSVIAVGVFVGSIGFPVIFALARRVWRPGRLSIHVKLTLTTTRMGNTESPSSGSSRRARSSPTRPRTPSSRTTT